MAGLGTLVLVVGPSGAGKDTLMQAAAERLAPTGRFHFVQREITRPADAGGENHIAIDGKAFAEKEAQDAYLLTWRAHGNCYAIPREPAHALRQAGVAVVANVSRTVLDAARARLQPVHIVEVSASPDVLRARIAARGRENAEDVAARVERGGAISISGSDITTVMNDQDLEDGVARMVAALEVASTAEWAPVN